MTTTDAHPTAAGAATGVRRASRDTQSPILGGVAAGLARHLGWPVAWVRAGFLVATALGGSGLLFYAGLWLVLPGDPLFEEEAPGLAGARRDGRRPGRVRRLADAGPMIALVALGIGLAIAAEAIVGHGVLLGAIVLAVVGVSLLWRQADEDQRARWVATSDPLSAGADRLAGGWFAVGRVAAGALLIVLAVVVFAIRDGRLSDAYDVLVSALLGGLGLAVAVGPWVRRLTTELSAERAERVRSQERADVAAHLHDSVLQTLALIQKNAHDATTVARLARSQERDLRAWLFETPATEGRTLADDLRQLVADTEAAYGVEVEVVTVGEPPPSAGLDPLVASVREALTNAAKHAGVQRIDVYAEVTPTQLEVFVRDRGVGFDPASVPEDRQGIRQSLEGRMARHGGAAEVRSEPGHGTEVRLRLPRPATGGS